MKGYARMKNLERQSSWQKVWILLSETDLVIYNQRADGMPLMSVDLVGCRITPADWLTQQKHPFRCFGNGFDLLFASDSKADQVKWMNAAGLISIGYTSKIANGSGIRKSRYKNCSMRLYRRVFPNKSKSRLDETVQSIDIERDKQLIEKTSPIRTRIIRRDLKSDDLIQLIDDLDIGSGLTRKQTMKRRMEQLSRDPVHNELLHQKIKYERQLKAMMNDLAKIDELLSHDEITDANMITFQNEHPDIVPALGDLYAIKPVSIRSLDSSTLSSNSEYHFNMSSSSFDETPSS